MCSQVIGLRKVVGFKICESLHRELKHLAVDAGKDVSELAELAIRLLLVISVTGIPSELAAAIERRDPELLERLEEVITQ